MEYMTPNFTKDMVKTHKILIPNMAVTQFRLMQAALASEGYQTEVLGNCGSEVAQLGLKYVHNDTCYPALLVIGQFLDALNSGKYDLDHTALLITQTGGGCRASNYIKLLRKALVKAGYGNIPVASLNFSGLEKGSGLPLTVPLLRKVIASIFYGDMLVALRSQTHAYENHRGDADAMTEKWISTIQGWICDDKNYSAHDLKLTMENQISKCPLELIYEIDQTIPCLLYGDAGRIRQVITNLVSNAIKYTEHGHVRFSVHVHKKDYDKVSLYYEVEDTGIGIRKEDQEILFDSFQRVDLKKNRRIQGTGLGLTISKNFVNMMGGTIGVESEYGKGSKFYFCIDQTIMDSTPISEINYEQRHNSVVSKEAESLFTAEDAHILLVDDNSLNLLVAQELLKPLQLQIDTAENGKDAVAMVQERHYDLVLMDHMMPVMDGIEATKAIRALPEPQYQNLPVIALTANAMVNAQKEFANAGMNGFVAKPIDFQMICNQLRKWLPKDMIHELTREEAEKILSDETDTADSITDTSTGSSAENPAGFRFENGLPYCGSEEALKQIIQIFYNTIDSKSKKIEQCLKEQLIKDYTIEVHALKSSALLIGAPGLSEAAKELEMYGNAQNLAALEEKTGPVLAMYRSLKSLLRPYVEDNESSKKEVSSDDWITVLEQMHQCVEQFDMDGVDHAMETMETFQTPDKLKNLMEQLRVCVADMEMEEIMKLTDTMVNLLQ